MSTLTNEQAAAFHSAVSRFLTLTTLDSIRATAARNAIAALRDDGWTVEPPEPRYAARETPEGGVWTVVDNEDIDANDEPRIAATYWRCHPDPERRAYAEAGALNRGEE